ncbi:MAG TPA: prolyl oligopeptidase family serine peptidase [Phycisphaerae bacterium]|jgi:dipeptidyl aminopeptidase/acylaminoacyl peptidase|nr:prolyl oligopeptidase family serine peptidase [Phycisphaerae bacterium]
MKPGLLIGLLLAASAVSSARAAEPETFTIPQTELVSRSARAVLTRGFDSPAQRDMAWIEDGNLFVARPPDFAPKLRISRRENGDVSRLFFARDGSLFVMRAGKGTPPTPDLVKLNPADDSALEVVTAGNALPSGRLWFAPDGNAFAFVEGTIIHEFRRSAARRWERRPLLDANDPRNTAATGVADLVYSPDGSRIAFESTRKARQKYIAIVDVVTHETRYIDPAIYRDDAPVWSPDGSELAFVREPGNWTMNYRFTPRRQGAPWSIVAYNLATRTLRTVWKADPGPGSVRTVFDPLPLWTPDGQILFTWEKTGWNLLYAVPARGGRATLLTPGQGEVDGVTLSADGRTLAYTANIGDLPRNHLWSISLPGGTPIQLTSGNGVETRAQFSAEGYLTYAAGNRDKGPPLLMIRSPDGQVRPAALLTADAAKRNEDLWNRFVAPDIVPVRAADGVTSYDVVTKPRTPPPAGGYPAIVYAHGGPDIQTRPGGGMGYSFGQYAVSRGYLFLDINYRGSTGFGLNYRLPEAAGAMGASELKDLQALVDYLKSRGDVNLKRVGILGHSYGGHIVGLAMSRLPDDFAAGASINGVADWNIEMALDARDGEEMSRPPDYMRLSQRTRIEDQAYDSSPSAHIAAWRGPTLLTFGDLDTLGHAEAVIDLGYQLLAQGVPVEFYADPAGGHAVFPQEHVFEFFERTLRNPASP